MDVVQFAVAQDAAGRTDEAIKVLRRAIAVAPSDRTKFHLAFLLLREGKYEEGWGLWEHRPARVGWGGRLSFPEWDGSPIKSLLVLPEQGFGDQIMFARYVPMLRSQGVEVTLFTKPDLVTLLSQFGVATFAASGDVKIQKHDAWVLCGSLPRLMGGRISSGPYLSGAATTRKGGIGIAWRGNPYPDPNRSMPPDIAAGLLKQTGTLSLDPEDTGARDFQHTADLVASLDLVISVDTATAHLAGAMGKPCFLLLPHHADWRWLRGRSDTPWYPSIRIFRQPKRGDWDTVISEAVQHAKAIAYSRTELS